MRDERFEHLMGRLLDEEATPDELRELVALAEQSPDLQAELQHQLETAEMLAQAEDDLRDGSLFVSTIQSRIGDDPFVSQVGSAIVGPPGPARTGSLGRPTLWAASLAAMIAIVVFASMFFREPVGEKAIATIADLNGAVQWTSGNGRVELDVEVGQSLAGGTIESLAADAWVTVTFHDGSTVTISGVSALAISEIDQKELHLRAGTLSATVSPQPAGKPLLIHTPTAELTVLGTQFNVDADAAATVLTVNRGKVRATRLADGSVADVPADHKIVAAASRLGAFHASPRPQSVSVWKSSLPKGIAYGTWTPQAQQLKAAPMLWRGCERNQHDPILLYVASLSVSRGDQPPVELRPGATFRVHGRLTASAEVLFGLTMLQPKGGFAGKHIARRRPDIAENGAFFVEIDLDEFKPEHAQYAQSPAGLVLYDWWSLTVKEDAGLMIERVELIQDASASPPDKPHAPDHSEPT
mgnify:FL=1